MYGDWHTLILKPIIFIAKLCHFFPQSGNPHTDLEINQVKLDIMKCGRLILASCHRSVQQVSHFPFSTGWDKKLS